MALQDKYKELVDAAAASGVTELQVREQDGVLYIDGEAPNGQTKDALWEIYNKLDPDFRSGDLMLNLAVSLMTAGARATVVTEHTNLNIRKGPGVDHPVVGKAAHNEMVTLLSKANEMWWLIRTDNGEEGYAYAQYLAVE